MKNVLLPALALAVATSLAAPAAFAQDGPYVPSQDTKANQKRLKAQSVANALKSAKAALKAKKAARDALAEAVAARKRSKAPIGSAEYANLADRETAAKATVDNAVDLRRKLKRALATRRNETLSQFLTRKDADFAREWNRSRAAAAGLAANLPSIPGNIDARQPRAAVPAGGVAAAPAQAAPRFNRAPLVYQQLPPERIQNYAQLPPEPSGQGQRQDYTGKLPAPRATPIYDSVPPIGGQGAQGAQGQNTPAAAPLPPPFVPPAAAGNVNYGLLPNAQAAAVQRLKFNNVQPALRAAITRAEQANPSGAPTAYERNQR